MALYLEHAIVPILDLYTTIQWESWLSTWNVQWWLYLICTQLSTGGIMAIYLQHAMAAILYYM
ncbi:hypothetical protein DPMN_116743 [Dreissena polymorpha]|uniref:Uncharacterized protein n=1 Tax=Dreissena polymorpha TaxID=45954 RepID=A0A9D4KNK5_DREPO|nr:hypothetical protein DPMN_116743 [Dreissena polymorpha]